MSFWCKIGIHDWDYKKKYTERICKHCPAEEENVDYVWRKKVTTRNCRHRPQIYQGSFGFFFVQCPTCGLTADSYQDRKDTWEDWKELTRGGD